MQASIDKYLEGQREIRILEIQLEAQRYANEHRMVPIQHDMLPYSSDSRDREVPRRTKEGEEKTIAPTTTSEAVKTLRNDRSK